MGYASAARPGLSASASASIEKTEAGDRMPSLDTYQRISELYGWPQASQSGSSVTSRLPRLTTSSRLYPEAR
jgi:hypothetical protein